MILPTLRFEVYEEWRVFVARELEAIEDPEQTMDVLNSRLSVVWKRFQCFQTVAPTPATHQKGA